jgi:hypothetical protein
MILTLKLYSCFLYLSPHCKSYDFRNTNNMGVSSSQYLLLVAIAILVLLPTQAEAFGAGNIASISKIEGQNWRHGDIEDMLATVACLKGHKWKSNMIKVRYSKFSSSTT